MTPEQALQLLDQIAAQTPLDRQGHTAVQQATQVLLAVVVDWRDLTTEEEVEDEEESEVEEAT